MKYTYFFLISAFITSLSHTMYIENSSTIIIFDIKEKEPHRKHIPLNQYKKTRFKNVQLDQHGIDGEDGPYQTGNIKNKFNIKIFDKPSKI